MVRRHVPMMVLLVALAAMAVCSGCGAYMANRGGDLLDCLDVGLTLTAWPGFAVHTDYFNQTPMGVSFVPKGRMIGLAQGEWVFWGPFHDWSWGVLAWGSQTRVLGPQDPIPAPRTNVGFLRLILQDNGPADWTYWACRRNIHVLWLGFYASMKPKEWADFATGWFGKDICHDDLAGLPEAYVEE